MTRFECPIVIEENLRSSIDLEKLQLETGVHPRHWIFPSEKIDHASGRTFLAYDASGELLAYVESRIEPRAAAAFGRKVVTFQNLVLHWRAPLDELMLQMAQWARGKAATSIIGPFSANLSMTRGIRLNHDGRHSALGLADTPSYVAPLMHQAGFQSIAEMSSFRLRPNPDARSQRIAAFVEQRTPDLRLRLLDPEQIENEAHWLCALYNSSWADHWAFIPLRPVDLIDALGRMRPIFDQNLALVAEIKEEPVGLCLGVPNPNFPTSEGVVEQPCVRGMFFGVAKEFQNRGIDGWLFDKALNHTTVAGFEEVEIGWILHSNDRWLSQLRSHFADRLLGETQYQILEFCL